MQNAKSSSEMIKKHFRLDREDDWPPVRLESLWCEQVERGYKVKNTPLFIKNLAFDDVIEVVEEKDGEVVSWQLVALSGNSTLWLFFREDAPESDVLDSLSKLGCGFEGGAYKGLFAVNIPMACSIESVEALLAPYEDAGCLEAAYPADRQ